MRIALLADIHSNLEALSAVAEDMEKHDIDAYRCAGDIIGYGASPTECVDFIREQGIPSCMGNHEYHLKRMSEGSTEFVPQVSEQAASGLKYTFKVLDQGRIDFLAGLPDALDEDFDGKRGFIVHGSPRDRMNDYVDLFMVENMQGRRKLLGYCDQPDFLVLGHTHEPFRASCEGSMIINPGSVGQPRDFNPRASYAVIDTSSMHAEILIVVYDIETAAKKIRKAGIHPNAAERLFMRLG